MGFGVKMNVKNTFFDRELVKRSMDKATYESLYRASMKIRNIAQTSMRYVTSEKMQRKQLREGERKKYRPPSVSQPGKPPKAIQPHPWIRKMLFGAYDPARGSYVVGPAIWEKGTGAPHTLEFGGASFIRNPGHTLYHLGWGGPISIGIGGGKTNKLTETSKMGTIPVTYTKLKTQAQVDIANRLNTQMYGPIGKVLIVAARPYMAPALAKGATKMADEYRNSLRKA